MTFVLYVAGIVLVGLIAVLVAWPLLAAQTASVQPLPAAEHIGRWEKQKAAAYAALREAEFDKQMGKLTDEDYQFIRQKYEARAIEALAQLDQLARKGPGSACAQECWVRPLAYLFYRDI